MVMGFVLPFALAFVAIPFETFVHSGRTVLGALTEGVLRMTAFILRLVGNLVRYLGSLAMNVYDLMTFPLLWAERMVKDRPARVPKKKPERPETLNGGGTQ
jgi:hypothetical protein